MAKQAISGVVPSAVAEQTVMVVWPSIAALSLGRGLGRLFSIRWGTYIFTLGNFIALATMPLTAIMCLS
ncbi:MAG TPA: PH domain-containing protein, partial [Pirellulaceae bacterium]